MQSVLHLNRSHASQPIGGVRARPLSRPWTPPPPNCRRNTAKSSVRRNSEEEEEEGEEQDICKRRNDFV